MANFAQALAESITALRKGAGMTQEELAGKLGLTFQAVSKWENGISSPDIALLPELADIFGVSVDALFGRSAPSAHGLPWANDDTLHAAVFLGHRLMNMAAEPGNWEFTLRGELRDVVSHGHIRCERIDGNASAQQDIQCQGNIGGSANAGGDIESGSIGGSANADGDIDCGAIGGGVNAGGDVDCGAIGGGVNAGGDVDCGDIGGNASAGGDIECGDIKGDASAGGDIECGDIGGNASAGGDIECGDIDGDVTCEGELHCREIQGDVTIKGSVHRES